VHLPESLAEAEHGRLARTPQSIGIDALRGASRFESFEAAAWAYRIPRGPPTRAPQTEGGGPYRLFRSSPRSRRLPRLAAHWADRPARASLRRLAAPCSGLGCLDGDADRAADSERGRHVGSCRRDWVRDSNPLTPIIDFSHLVISCGNYCTVSPAVWPLKRKRLPREEAFALSEPWRAHLRMGGAQPHNFWGRVLISILISCVPDSYSTARPASALRCLSSSSNGRSLLGSGLVENGVAASSDLLDAAVQAGASPPSIGCPGYSSVSRTPSPLH
jgi:hypothetical protein